MWPAGSQGVPVEVVALDTEMGLGEARRLSETTEGLKMTYLVPWLAWLVGSQGMFVGVGS